MTTPGPATAPVRRDALVDALRAAGCVYAEEEAAEVRRVRGPGDHPDVAAGRVAGVPLEHLLGVVRLGDDDLAVGPGCFVPRQRTLALVAAAADGWPEARVVVDVGCGVGALGVGLATLLPDAEVHLCDLDPTALAHARANAAPRGLAVHEGDWLEALPERLRGRVDLVVAYLPHVPDAGLALLPRDARAHEPTATVAGGADGLDAFRVVVAQLPRWCAADGTLVTLLAEEQEPAALAAARSAPAVRSARTLLREDDDVVLAVTSGPLP